MTNTHVTFFLQLLERDISKMQSEIEAYSTEELLWITSGTIKNPGGNLCLHIIGSLNHFIGTVLGNTGYVRHYDEEFLEKGISKEELLTELEKSKIIVRNTLASLTDDDLRKIFPKKWLENDVPVYWFLTHLLSHLNYHLGQINYHRRMTLLNSN